MKKYFIKFFFSVCIALFTLSAQAADNYTIDESHSFVLWHISHLGYSNFSGKWHVTGTLQLDKTKPENSKVNVNVQIADIITGIPDLDKHLMTKDFFNVEKFPTATFVSDKVDVTGKDTAKVTGNLTLLGVTKPITLDMHLNKIAPHPYTKKETVGFSGTAQLKRSDFGMTNYVPQVGDDVKLEIEVEAEKQA